MSKAIKAELLKNTGDFKTTREADQIIAYLADPSSESSLPAKLKIKLDRYTLIHGLRMRYKDHKYIIGFLTKDKARTERQARTDIAETEYIFGAAINVSRRYEMNFLLEASRKNIGIAMKTKDPVKISKALDVHKKILGEDVDMSQLPDFSKLEQHNYNIVLPANVLEVLKSFIDNGALNLSELLPSKMLSPKPNEP